MRTENIYENAESCKGKKCPPCGEWVITGGAREGKC